MKSFLEEYGFAILGAIVVIVLILMTSPVGMSVKNSLVGTVEQLSEVSVDAFAGANEHLNESIKEISGDDGEPGLCDNCYYVIFNANGGTFTNGSTVYKEMYEYDYEQDHSFFVWASDDEIREATGANEWYDEEFGWTMSFGEHSVAEYLRHDGNYIFVNFDEDEDEQGNFVYTAVWEEVEPLMIIHFANDFAQREKEYNKYDITIYSSLYYLYQPREDGLVELVKVYLGEDGRWYYICGGGIWPFEEPFGLDYEIVDTPLEVYYDGSVC